jgi:hypothetical protein
LHHWDNKNMPPIPSFFHWDEALQTFCPCWPGIAILLISASHVLWDDRHMPQYQLIFLILSFEATKSWVQNPSPTKKKKRQQKSFGEVQFFLLFLCF